MKLKPVEVLVGVIVVRAGGGGQILKVRDAPTWQTFNPTDNTLSILQP